MIRIAWNISHLEFTISDYYYFLKLMKELTSRGAYVSEIDDLKQAF